MCRNRDWFSTYRGINGEKVLMGNNTPCKVVEIGTVEIKMFDGTVRTLTDVRHVPELKKNLISLGEKTNGLYLLKGITITGAAGVSSSLKKLDTTKLWHMRLGNMSDRGMMELSKRGLLCGQNTRKFEFYEHCVFEKQHRVKFDTTVHRTKAVEDDDREADWKVHQALEN
nr:putative polyprotein [Tanacetum cinerariifolium]